MRHLLLASLALAVPASAQNLDNFDSGTNPNGWAWNGFVSSIVEPVGGNPGGYLHGGPGLFANYPILTSGTTASGAWVGDYRANSVSEIRFDAQAFSGPSGFGAMTLLLVDDNGTNSTADDNVAYYIDPINVSPPLGAWVPYSFVVPSSDTSPLPAGWQAGNGGSLGNGFSAGYDWNDLIQSVDQVEIHFSDPTWFYITQTWDMGIDNLEVVAAPVFTLSMPVPGTPGGVASLETINGTPGQAAYFGYSLIAANSVVGCGGTTVTAGILNPQLAGSATADGAGTATLQVGIPVGAAGRTVHIQALDRATCTLSNVLTHTF